MASGKSTVADALARRLNRAAHVRGDMFRRMIVSGQAAMSSPLSSEALAQLHLRQRLAAGTAVEYARAGITAVVQDLYLGGDLPRMISMVQHRPLYLFVLAPQVGVVEVRELAREKSGYGAEWSVAAFDRHLREETPRLGLWLDTSDLTVEQTIDGMLENLSEAWID
ncbi:phosphotransferase [Arthrobacter sp. ISL-48]|nr:phosphotransferase [Arthrobacter sp. ISL-48]